MSNGPLRILDGRLRLELDSDRHENLRKRVSDDSQRFIFPRRKTIFGEIFGSQKTVCCSFREVLGVARPNGPHHDILRQILLSMDLF